MCALGVVMMEPCVQIGLKLVDALIQVLSERDLIEFLQDGFVEPLTDAVGLGVVNVIVGQEELIVMFVRLAAKLRAPVGQDTQHRQVMLLIERQHSIIEEISSGDRRLGGIELGMGHFAIGVDIGLLVHPTNALDGADIEGVLTAEIAGMGRFHLAAGLIVMLLLLKSLDLCLGQDDTVFSNLGLQRFQPILEVGKLMPQPDRADAEGRDKHAACATRWRCGPDHRRESPGPI